MKKEYNTLKDKKTVFFGPFFGEFGWEASFWHGWVRKMCRKKYRSYRKIAASYPGREPFYPDVDEFWPHPSEINKLKISQRGYIADCWIGNLPETDNQTGIDKNIGQYAERLFQKYQKELPDNTIFYVPYKLNTYQLNGNKYLFGVLFLKGLILYRMPKTLSLKFEHQIFESLEPTSEGREFLQQIVDSKKKIIAVFPRYRLSRRIDKSWPREKYDLLIKDLQRKYTEHIIGIFGAPGGAYYVDGVPSGCLDLINLPKEKGFDVQLAALKQSDIAIGSISGALRVAQLAQCPVVEWGPPIEQKEVLEKQNFLKTRSIFWPEKNPSVEIVENLVHLMMEEKEKEVVYPKFLKESEKEELYYKKLHISLILREIVSRPFLMYLRRKKLKEGTINNFLIKK